MFHPSRLRQARRRRGLTKVKLGQLVGLSARRIAAFENEGEDPPASTVEALAGALRFPVSFFYRDAAELLEPSRVSFRSFTKMPAHMRDMAIEGASLAAEVAVWIDERFELPAVDVPDLRDVDPVAAAAALRSTWALGELPAPNLVHLLEAHGVRVFSLVDGCASLDALSTWVDEKPFVFLTNHKSPERARWDAAHELGHITMHLGVAPQGRVLEEQADIFASEFLMPERGVRARATRHTTLQSIRTEKLYWRVSALAYIRRLHQLGIISDWHYKSLAIEASQAGYRRREGDIERETSQLIPKVLGMLRVEGVTIAAIAADLDLTPAELRGLLFSPLGAVSGPSSDQGSTPPSPRPNLRIV